MTYKVAILTISDRASEGVYEDLAGPVLEEAATAFGLDVFYKKILADEKKLIEKALIEAAEEGADLILTTGGTGFGPRDITPEATKAVIDKEAPGIGEAMRAASADITPMAYLSRATAGIYKNTLIINFPGSPKAAAENFAAIKPFLIHGLATLKGASH